MNHLESMSLNDNESTENQEESHQEGHLSASEDSTPLDENPMSSGAVQESEPGEDPAKHKAHRQHFEQFLSELEKRPDSESKLQFAIDFMEGSLAQAGTPHFKSFWEARTICLNLFKENISPVLRSNLWAKYNELSKEARRLKEILDEQSAFAVEQIEIAVKALEDDILAFDEHLQKVAPFHFEIQSQALANRISHYQQIQRELNLLNTHASRINALRKELIRTEMRVRQKNKFFQRLSAAGDKVFPRRKDLIKDVSQCFMDDVDAFMETHFKNTDYRDSLFNLREEIKALQNMAKVLTLNTHSFTHTRMRLSECWDQIKNEEKERKKERAQQKAAFKENVDDAMQRLQAFKEAYERDQPSNAEATKQLEEVTAYIRSLEFGRDEIRMLKEEIALARKPILDKLQAVEMERQQLDLEKEKQRRQKALEVRQDVEELLKNSHSLDADTIIAQRDAILEKMSVTTMGKAEKLEIERQLKPLKDLISEKKESSLLTLSDDDRQSLAQFKEVLRQRKERRQEIKDQIDALRKASGNSGFDFVQAMNANTQLEAEKDRLEKINQGIQEVEQKIKELRK